MPRILVTGATGFIGVHLVAKLRMLHHEVIALDRRSGDIAENETWQRLPDVDVVVHLAARTFVPDSWLDPNDFIRINVGGTANSLAYCAHRKARLVFISSYLYGAPEKLPIAEGNALNANNPYALSKKLAEEACRFYSDHFGVRVTILRPFNVYGPNQDAKFLIPSIIQQVSKDESVHVRDLDPKRDYVYIDDLIDAFIKAIELPQLFDVFNIGSGQSHSVKEVIDLIFQLTKKSLPITVIGNRRPQELMDTRADIGHARQILEWEPRWSLRAGLTKILGENNYLS